VRSQISLKPETYTESMYVDVAGISGKVNAHYPGRSVPEQRAEVSRSHSTLQEEKNAKEGQNVK
jgi:hypothetical protein